MASSPGKTYRATPRFRTPTVLQMEAVECGAAALASVLGYYGRFVSLEELRAACGVSRDGTKASNILKAARSYGLKAKGFSKRAEETPDVPLPAIVFWNFNHFVVLEGFRKGKVYLNDPSMGPRVVDQQEFEQCFTGVILVFEPDESFVRGGSRPRAAAALRSRLKNVLSSVAFVLFVSLALSLTGLVLPIFTKVFVDHVLVRENRSWVAPLLIGLGITAVFRMGLTWMQRNALLRLSTKLAVGSSYRFLQHLLRLPVEFFTQRYGGEVGARMEANDRIASVLSGQVAANLLNVLMAGLYLFLLIRLDVVLTVITVTFAACNFIALRLVSRHRKDVSVHLLQERGKLMGMSMAGIQGIESIKATGREHDFFSRWSGQMAKTLVSEQKFEESSLGLEAVPSFLTMLSTVAILGVGAMRVMDGHMTVGAVVAFEGLMLGFMDPISQLLSLGGDLQELEGELGRLDDVLRHPIDPGLASESILPPPGTSPKLMGHVELKEISYGYSRMSPPLISGFNLSARPGTRVAFVGFSASGKSTLAKIISGLYRPWDGEVLLDGKPRTEIPRSQIVNSVAMVDQDFFLYEGSVRDILTLWDSTVPESDMIQAAKDACIHEEIAARPGGYDSRVEEGGRNFSIGQQQRLEIARALVLNPSVLILDEATSALDPITERQIDENLRRRGCTCIIVAHRLSTIRDCDEIIVLDHGTIVQRGTHESLLAVRGPYQELISA